MSNSNKRPKFQTVELTVPAGTNVNTIKETREALDSNYSKATAIALVRVSGTDDIAFGFRAQNDQVIDLTHSKLFEVEQNTPVTGRMMSVPNVPAGGKEVTLQGQPLLATTLTDNVFHLVLKLEE